ncbi:hypothetical protein BDV38DRAFT_210323 [Aspergillus pseudotamarii]|uniref:Uncharacterized protein n=1 Tax=Aspergillus pseudotamarii TaxID=132259 RepID=A0A5N6SF42_ASPPS|nr:uncharacterized protein BDV38DRAFT_210323 [Aspergillus pseudotamarii]KAE8132479.1 hypothetical protein BDV38DRAFT_210323 [Aspergillus pseudotamarii]
MYRERAYPPIAGLERETRKTRETRKLCCRSLASLWESRADNQLTKSPSHTRWPAAGDQRPNAGTVHCLLPPLLVPIGWSCFVIYLSPLVMNDDGRLRSAWTCVGPYDTRTVPLVTALVQVGDNGQGAERGTSC